MLRDGRYAAWFRTPRGQGTGVIELKDGVISGNDSFFSYAGRYQVDGDRFTAVLTTRRHADGPPTVFGLDDVELDLTGVCTGVMATCSGIAVQVPDVTFEATLIYSREDVRSPEAPGVVRLKTERVTGGPVSRSRMPPRLPGPAR